MEIRKMVDRDTLTPEELEALDNGEKTEEDFITEAEEAEKAKQEAILEEAKKAKELADNYKIRAEKAEAKKADKETPKTDLSQKDLIALIRAEVPEDDFDEVTDYARLKNISVSEALKSSVIKTVLSEKKEERATAAATATGNKGPGAKASSGSELLQRAKSKGEMPDDEEGMKKLIEASFK
jgi:hypothetical protein